MVTINRVYTRGGDAGKTSLGNGERRQKNDPRITVLGELDELGAHIGLARCALAIGRTDGADDRGETGRTDETDDSDCASDELMRIQNDLFDLGADLCLPYDETTEEKEVLRVSPEHVKRLEGAIDALTKQLTPLKSFILAGGSEYASRVHLCRAVCRRAERSMAELNFSAGERVNEAAISYINRLSDYLFVAARMGNDAGRKDIVWQPNKHGKGGARV